MLLYVEHIRRDRERENQSASVGNWRAKTHIKTLDRHYLPSDHHSSTALFSIVLVLLGFILLLHLLSLKLKFPLYSCSASISSRRKCVFVCIHIFMCSCSCAGCRFLFRKSHFKCATICMMMMIYAKSENHTLSHKIYT